jgi:hypothetical protein
VCRVTGSRVAILAVFAGLTVYAWAHWDDVDIDNRRETYVPSAIARGKVLYRDLCYSYGPLAPYLLARLFRWLGFWPDDHSSFCAPSCRDQPPFLPSEFAFVASFSALIQTFQTDIFNYICPTRTPPPSARSSDWRAFTSYCGAFLKAPVCCCRWPGCCAGLALTCKPEFGCAGSFCPRFASGTHLR